MQSELKKKWIEALRSGKYEQGNGVLRRQDDKFCCLGVLCDISGCEWDNSFNSYSAKYKNTYSINILPETFAKEQNIERGLQNDLWKRNDGVDGQRKHSFNEIADWIEANVPITDGV